MLKIVLIASVASIVIFALVGALLSQHYVASRSIVIHASTAQVFPLLAELTNWPKWEPFLEQDPTMLTTLGAKTTGIGASQSWAGAKGGGRLTFKECDPKTGIAYDLVFVNGDNEASAVSWMHMNPRTDGSTEVVWGIDGELNMPVLGGYMAKFSDDMVGPMFERGLNRLKLVAESLPAAGG